MSWAALAFLAAAMGRQPSARRGLPANDELSELAATYLREQARLWPDQVGHRFPRNSVRACGMLADKFEAAFLNPQWQPTVSALPVGQAVAACYLRFSCDNSNPRSLAQQLRNCLERAHRDGLFVPWALVFADAAVTGTHANRRGYQMSRLVMDGEQEVAGVLVIDEIGRASRDSVEALELGRSIERTARRLLGASDGFDSATAQSRMMLGIFAMLHEWFVDQLRHKVARGMRDAFQRGDVVGTAGFGYVMEKLTDADGNVVFTPKGTVQQQKRVCEQMAKDVVRSSSYSCIASGVPMYRSLDHRAPRQDPA